MANYNPPPTSISSEENLAYDLRQIYAVNLVGEHLQDVARARKADDYQSYFKSLKDLWIITQHKIKDKNKNAPEEYKKLIKIAIEIMNKNSNALNKKSNNNIGKAYIEAVLNNIEMFLYDCLSAAGIFGSKWDDDGL